MPAKPRANVAPQDVCSRVRREKIVSIDGDKTTVDIVTQAEINRLANLQRAHWIASRVAAKVAIEIEMRLQHGAHVEAGPFIFDRDMKMATGSKRVNEK